jgi:hypothetical protein
MPELLRSVVSRMQVYVKDRRRSTRLRIRLLFSVSLCPNGKGNGSQREHVLKGHTRDLSPHGLALNVPQVHLDGHHLAAGGRELQLKLELPGGPISMTVTPRRYERLDESELGCNYLIGAQISSISEEERLRYLAFIAQSLGVGARP